MSSYAKPNVLTFFAGAAISKGMAVKFGADSKHVVKSALATDKNIGIALCDAASAEDLVEVALPGGGASGLLVGSVSAGDLLTPDSTGKLVATTTANDRVIAIAMDDGVAGDLISVHVAASNY